MKRPGPELKMPELKAPQFLGDLYWDLRDRRLLPLVALVVVAIVAVPFLLGGKSDRVRPPAVGLSAPAAGARSGGSTLVAVQANPGLRDYRDRLAHRSPNDPFKQRFTAAQTAGAQLGGGESEASSGGSGEKGGSGGEAGGGGASPGSGSTGPTTLTRYTTAVNVKVTITKTLPSGKKETKGPTLHKRVIPVAPLPSQKVQAVAYMGTSPETNHPILLISDAVTAIFGDGRCLSGAETCQLLELEPGIPETFVFGPESTRYKLVLLNPRPVAIGHTQVP
jgi:hypothetical protein